MLYLESGDLYSDVDDNDATCLLLLFQNILLGGGLWIVSGLRLRQSGSALGDTCGSPDLLPAARAALAQIRIKNPMQGYRHHPASGRVRTTFLSSPPASSILHTALGHKSERNSYGTLPKRL